MGIKISMQISKCQNQNKPAQPKAVIGGSFTCNGCQQDCSGIMGSNYNPSPTDGACLNFKS